MKTLLIFISLFLFTVTSASAYTLLNGKENPNAYSDNNPPKWNPNTGIGPSAAERRNTIPPPKMADIQAAQKLRRDLGYYRSVPLGLFFPKGHRLHVDSILYGDVQSHRCVKSSGDCDY